MTLIYIYPSDLLFFFFFFFYLNVCYKLKIGCIFVLFVVFIIIIFNLFFFVFVFLSTGILKLVKVNFVFVLSCTS